MTLAVITNSNEVEIIQIPRHGYDLAPMDVVTRSPAYPPAGPCLQQSMDSASEVGLAEQPASAQDDRRLVKLAMVPFVERANVQTPGVLEKVEVFCGRGAKVTNVGRINPVHIDHLGTGFPA
jgi:hypothetical protein